MEPEMESRTIPQDDVVDLAKVFRAVFRRIRLIAGITAASAVVALVVSFLLPHYFKAETRIFPPPG